MLDANEFERSTVQLVKVTEHRPGKAPAEFAWIQFTATKKAVDVIKREGWLLFHVSNTDSELMLLKGPNARAKEALKIRDMLPAQIEAEYAHRG